MQLNSILVSLAGWLTGVCTCASPADAQIVASERASVSQTIDGTHFRVDYGRPRVRGRDSLFGKLEPFGRAWTPGADSATTLTVDKLVRVLGQPVPAGRYSIWLVASAHGPWTFVLDPRWGLFHTAFPDSTPAQIRASVMPNAVPHTEALTWSFPVVTTTGTTLEMRWGTTGIDVPIDVTPTYAPTVSATDAAPYLGDYDFVDLPEQDRAERPRVLTISRRPDGVMLGQWRVDGALRGWQLLPEGRRDTFVQGNRVRDELWSVVSWQRVAFTRDASGRVVSFVIRNDSTINARGTRRSP